MDKKSDKYKGSLVLWIAGEIVLFLTILGLIKKKKRMRNKKEM